MGAGLPVWLPCVGDDPTAARALGTMLHSNDECLIQMMNVVSKMMSFARSLAGSLLKPLYDTCKEQLSGAEKSCILSRKTMHFIAKNDEFLSNNDNLWINNVAFLSNNGD